MAFARPKTTQLSATKSCRPSVPGQLNHQSAKGASEISHEIDPEEVRAQQQPADLSASKNNEPGHVEQLRKLDQDTDEEGEYCKHRWPGFGYGKAKTEVDRHRP